MAEYTDAYIASVAAGENALQTDIITFWTQCPTLTRLKLVSIDSVADGVEGCRKFVGEG